MLGAVRTYPLNAWRYFLRVDVNGADRQNLPDCLEAEDLALFGFLPREEVYEQIRSGALVLAASGHVPFQSFASDLAVLSMYLFQVIKGVEVAERHVAEDEVDDVRAWKIVARQGEWVKIPLCVSCDDDGRFHVDEEADDLEIIRARWASYPLWFQDGMRRKHPSLRAL